MGGWSRPRSGSTSVGCRSTSSVAYAASSARLGAGIHRAGSQKDMSSCSSQTTPHLPRAPTQSLLSAPFSQVPSPSASRLDPTAGNGAPEPQQGHHWCPEAVGEGLPSWRGPGCFILCSAGWKHVAACCPTRAQAGAVAPAPGPGVGRPGRVRALAAAAPWPGPHPR